MRVERPVLRVVMLLVAGVVLCAGARAQAMLRKAVRPSPGPHAAAHEVPLRSADGARIGTWMAVPEGVRLRPRGRAEFLAPALQAWTASPDGRTLVGAGDPAAPERALELQVAVFRDGESVAVLAEELAPESEITVGADGRVGIVGHRAGAMGRPFGLVLEPDGRLFRHALPEGSLARDPVFIGTRLFARAHGISDEGEDGNVLALEADGTWTRIEIPGALSLVGFPAEGSALVRRRDELIWLDAETLQVSWRTRFEERPAGPHAWAFWRTGAREVLAVVTASLRRRGAPTVAPALLVLDAADGTLLERVELERLGPASEVDVLPRGDELLVDWRGAEEVFTWNR